MPVKSWKRSQVIGTREHLIETAQVLFGERGYGGTALEEVVARAGLTRGAVYHHFEDKRGLFRAVVDRVLWDLVNAVEKRTLKRAAAKGGEPESDALELFVEELSDPVTQRIVLVDGPAVLGHDDWSELLGARLLDPVRRAVDRAAEDGELDPALAPTATRLLFAALQEAALLAGRPNAERADIDRTLSWMLDRLLGPRPS